MKIIDLLNKIAKGEKLPKKIKYEEREYILNSEEVEGKNYICYAEDNLPEDVWGELCFDTYNLNNEVEILEGE